MTRYFERQLYWVGKSTMRAPLSDACFPSWSWVGWQGEVSFRYHLTYDPAILCFVMQGDNGSKKCSPVSVSPVQVSEAGHGDLQSEEDMLASINAFETASGRNRLNHKCTLFFYTELATFYLIPQGRLILPDLKARYNYRGDKILGPKPDYGYLAPSLDDSELCEKDYRECILLGRRPAPSAWDVPHVVVMLITRVSGTAYRHGIADMSEEF